MKGQRSRSETAAMSRQYLFVCSDEREPKSMREDGQTGDHALNTSHKVGACAGGLAPVHICRATASAVRVGMSGVCPTQARHAGFAFGGHKRRRQLCGSFGTSHTSRSDSCVLQGTWGVGWSFISAIELLHTRARGPGQNQRATKAALPELYPTRRAGGVT